jgi:hypothetical protein
MSCLDCEGRRRGRAPGRLSDRLAEQVFSGVCALGYGTGPHRNPRDSSRDGLDANSPEGAPSSAVVKSLDVVWRPAALLVGDVVGRLGREKLADLLRGVGCGDSFGGIGGRARRGLRALRRA